MSVQWLQTKEEWDRERVFLAEMGYLPDDANPEVLLPLAYVPLNRRPMWYTQSSVLAPALALSITPDL